MNHTDLSADVPLISTQITRASTVVLLLGGLSLLFAADVILPLLVPRLPATAAWIGHCSAPHGSQLLR